MDDNENKTKEPRETPPTFGLNSRAPEVPEVNLTMKCQEEKDLPTPAQHRSKNWRPIVFKSEEQVQAEYLFYQYCYPKTWYWQYPEWKQATLAILGSGIFQDNTLKGADRHGITYPVDLGHLIDDLVHLHFEYDVNLHPLQKFHRLEGPVEREILEEFDEHFNFVSGIAHLAGIRKDVIKRVWEEWRAAVYNRAAEGKIPHRWRDIVINALFPGQYPRKKIAFAFADVFLLNGPHAIACPHDPYIVPSNRVVIWVNAVLKSLRRPLAGKRSLHDYIERHKAPPEPVELT